MTEVGGGCPSSVPVATPLAFKSLKEKEIIAKNITKCVNEKRKTIFIYNGNAKLVKQDNLNNLRETLNSGPIYPDSQKYNRPSERENRMRTK